MISINDEISLKRLLKLFMHSSKSSLCCVIVIFVIQSNLGNFILIHSIYSNYFFHAKIYFRSPYINLSLVAGEQQLELPSFVCTVLVRSTILMFSYASCAVR